MEEEESQLQTNCSRQSSLFLNSGSLVIFSVVVFVVLSMPSFLSSTFLMFRPDRSVKTSWDFLNLVLVVFAVLCAFLGRNTGENHRGQFEDYNHDASIRSERVYRSNSLPEHECHQCYDWADYNVMTSSLRSCSSYPDLRRESSMVFGDEIWRFSDDTRFLNSVNNIEANVRTKSGTESKKKRSGRVSSTKEFSNSYKRKMKAERRKSFESFETLISPDHGQAPPTIPPLFYQNISSSRKGRTKKINSTPSSLSPSPKTETCAYNFPVRNCLPPNGTTSFKNGDDNDDTCSDSPLFTIPPPPPLPPFRMPEWEFAEKGDFISIKSNSNSPRGLSPEVDEDQGWPSQTVDGEVSAGADINTEAESFIARFRAGLKLERMNSV